MTAGIRGVLKEYSDQLGEPLLIAAETGEYAWGVEDDTTPHKVTAMRLPSPVEYATVDSDPRPHRTTANHDPLGKLANERGIRNDVTIQVYDCTSALDELKHYNPRIIHILQSETTYIDVHEQLALVRDAVFENINALKLGSKYQNYAIQQARKLSDSDNPLTAGDFVGIVASAARAHYISRNRSLPPMHIDAFRDVAQDEIEIGVPLSEIDDAVEVIRSDGRSTPFGDADTLQTVLNERFFDEGLKEQYNISRRQGSVNWSILDEAITALHSEYYSVEQ